MKATIYVAQGCKEERDSRCICEIDNKSSLESCCCAIRSKISADLFCNLLYADTVNVHPTHNIRVYQSKINNKSYTMGSLLFCTRPYNGSALVFHAPHSQQQQQQQHHNYVGRMLSTYSTLYM